jgi:hypothetical protein
MIARAPDSGARWKDPMNGGEKQVSVVSWSHPALRASCEAMADELTRMFMKVKKKKAGCKLALGVSTVPYTATAVQLTVSIRFRAVP